MEVFIERATPTDVVPGPLSPLAMQAAEKLKASAHTVSVFESTSAGLINAALMSINGSSAYMSPGTVTYGAKKATVLFGADFSEDHPTRYLPAPCTTTEYIASKQRYTAAVARRMRGEVGATWAVCEAGACGPTFNVSDGMSTGFSVIFVSGPVERGVVLRSEHNRREENMWAYAAGGLGFLAECIAEAVVAAEVGPSTTLVAAAPVPKLLEVQYDRYGGAEMEVPLAAAIASVGRFDIELGAAVAAAQADGKKGLWLKVPLACAAFVGSAAARGFLFHHAKEEYVLLTRWLPTDAPSPLPKYAFTQIGVGGVVVNKRNEVLMVQERVSPIPLYQGSWKLPGGLADAGEDFAATVRREVLEETGVRAGLEGVVSMRHMHGVRFGQGDLYVVVKLRTEGEEEVPPITLDPHELMGARWMSREQIEEIVAGVSYRGALDGFVSESNWTMIKQGLDGPLITGAKLEGHKPSMLYTAPKLHA